jgi:hypothetical protein
MKSKNGPIKSASAQSPKSDRNTSAKTGADDNSESTSRRNAASDLLERNGSQDATPSRSDAEARCYPHARVRLPGVDRPLVAFVRDLMAVLASSGRVFTRGSKVVEIVLDPSDGAERLQLVRPTYAQTMFERYASLRDVDGHVRSNAGIYIMTCRNLLKDTSTRFAWSVRPNTGTGSNRGVRTPACSRESAILPPQANGFVPLPSLV